MKTYNLRVTTKLVKYCKVTAKSLEEAVAQAEYQMLVNPPTEIDGTKVTKRTIQMKNPYSVSPVT